MSPRRASHTPARAAAALLALALLAVAVPAGAADDFSPAERALFMSDQLAGMKTPATLRYRFEKSGTLEAGFTDAVTLHVDRRADHQCCSASVNFLSGERRLSLPAVDAPQGNPVLLYFLERDIHEMSRLTHGLPNYFRKRIRMAVYQGAQIDPVRLRYQGRTITAQRITIAPYVDDPLHQRFETLTAKRYEFTLSDQVPGGVAEVRTRVAGAAPGAQALLAEEMRLDGIAAEP